MFSIFNIVFYILIASFLLSAGIGVYSLSFSKNLTARLFSLLMLVLSIWILHKIVILFIVSEETRAFLHLVNIFFIVLIGPLIFLISVFHTKHLKWFKQKHSYLVFIVPAIIYLLVFIPACHHWLFYDFNVRIEHGIPLHSFKMNIGYFIILAHSYILFILSFALLIIAIYRRTGYYRRQMLLFFIGLFIPFLVDTVYILGFSPIKHFNFAPVTMALSNCLIAWSLFGYRFFKLIPVARNVVIDKIEDIMIVTNSDHIVIDINKSGETTFKLYRNKTIGKLFYDIFIIYPELIENYDLRNNLVKELTFTNSGEIKHYSITISSIEDENNKISVNIILLHDITERKKSEDTVQLSEKKYKEAEKIGKVGHWEYDLIHDILTWSEQTFRIHELMPIDFKPSYKKVVDLYHPEDRQMVEYEFHKAIKDKTNLETEHRIITSNGKIKYVIQRATTKYDKYGNPTISLGTVADITERKNAELLIKQQNRELKELNATKDKFFSIIGHDLRNPFNSILGYSKLLSLDKNPEKNAEYAEIILKSANTAYNLIDNLLNWAHSQTGDIKYKPENIRLAPIVSEIAELVRNQYELKKIKLENKIDNKLIVFADRDMLNSILQNLITNAIKFTHDNGQIKLSAKINDKLSEISVTDTGIGMSHLAINKLFKISEKQTSHGTAQEKGTGLGLLLCKEFIEKHGGSMWVKSELGNGSVFTFSIPISDNPDINFIEMKEETPILKEIEKDFEYSIDFLENIVPLKRSLAEFDYYETSEILKTLQSYKPVNEDFIKWKKDVENAVFYSNKNKYMELISF